MSWTINHTIIAPFNNSNLLTDGLIVTHQINPVIQIGGGGTNVIHGRIQLTNLGDNITFDAIGSTEEDYSFTYSCFNDNSTVNCQFSNWANNGFTVVPALEDGETCTFNYQIIPL